MGNKKKSRMMGVLDKAIDKAKPTPKRAAKLRKALAGKSPKSIFLKPGWWG